MLLQAKEKPSVTKLLYDVARCHDHACPFNYDCLRYKQRSVANEFTPHVASLRDGSTTHCPSLITQKDSPPDTELPLPPPVPDPPEVPGLPDPPPPPKSR